MPDPAPDSPESDGAPNDSVDDRAAEYEQPPRLPFPVVGIGASAGGLEALSEFFKSAPPDSGMAFVLIQHLPPERDSMLADILSKRTAMPVREVEDGVRVEPDHVYVIRPGRTLTIKDAFLRLGEPLETPGHRRVVDDFFRSLAEEQRERAICIVMSGMGSNGSAGAREVKAVGGVCIAQDPESAKFPFMPRSLIDAGLADFVLPPQDMPNVLLRYAGHPYATGEHPAEAILRREGRRLSEVLALVRARARHDFSGYKKPTVLRRIQRRMGLAQITKLGEYTKLLRQNPGEVSALADDLMIHVTGFFRDANAWESLRLRVLEPLIAEREADGPVRCWVTACSSGEEAYSLAILLVEAAEAAGKPLDIKIFATDTAARTVMQARNGVYPAGVEAEISPERLDRFFDKGDATYRVKQELRELVVFAPQNLLHDPPFSRLDICTCRNLLIYLEPVIQRRVLALLHFGLREGGALFLGTSETVSGTEGLFEPVDSRWRIFRRVGPTRHDSLDFPAPASLGGSAEREQIPGRPASRASIAAITNKVLLDRYTPPAVTVDRQQRIVYFHGDTDPFLNYPRGEPTRELLAVARDGVRGAIRAALHKAISENVPARARDGSIETEQGRRRTTVTASPLDTKIAPGFYLVSFEVHPELPSAPDNGNGKEDSEQQHQLEDDLQRARDEREGMVQELQASNEELKASNEEVISVNEELQSTNEELETGKEEMQSLNEELTTVNTQLQAKMEELEGATNDLNSLLGSTDIAVIFLDIRFHIRRFTSPARDLLELIPSDIGRPLSDLALKFTDPDLQGDARMVLEKLIPIEREVASNSGRWYLRRILPYRTAEDRIEGVVVTFVDITARKKAEDALRAGQQRLSRVVQAETVGIAFFDHAGRITDANNMFLSMIGYDRDELKLGLVWWDRLTPSEWMPRTREAMEALKSTGRFAPYDMQYFRKDGTRWWGLFTGSSLSADEGVFFVIDAGQRKQAEEEHATSLEREKAARLAMEAAVRLRDEFVAVVSHELRTPLSAILIWSKMLHDQAKAGKQVASGQLREGLDAIEKSAEAQRQLIDDLLDTARITAGKLRLEQSKTDLAAVVRDAVDSMKPTADVKGIVVELDIRPNIGVVSADANRLRQVVWNLLSNAVKFTPAGGRVSVGLWRRGDQVEVRVADTGKGISADFIPRLFVPFNQAEPVTTRVFGGLGLGLAICRQLVELHGGTIQAESPGEGQGAVFTVRLPLPRLRKSAQSRPAVSGQFGGNLAGIRALLVEDDPDTGGALTSLLDKAGMLVTVVPSAAEALESLKHGRPDLLISDIGLPGMDGYEMLRQIRAEEQAAGLKAIPAVALTAFASSEDRRKAAEAGYQGHVAKPVEPRRLLNDLETFVIKGLKGRQ